jgi:tight adherence protein B
VTPTLIAIAAVTAGFSLGVAIEVRGHEALLSHLTGPATPRPRFSRLGSFTADRTTIVVGVAIVGWVVWHVAGAVVAVSLVAAVPRIRQRRETSRRASLLEDQLAEAVTSLSAALRAGMSLSQAIGYIAAEGTEPLASTFRRASDRIGLGLSLEDALGRWEAETPGADARLVAGVLRLHRRTGGELPVVLDQLATTLDERRAAMQEVHALTAQARLSGAILGFLPIGFFLFLSVTSRDQIDAAFRTPAGIASVVIGLTLQGLAFVWIRRLLRVS